VSPEVRKRLEFNFHTLTARPIVCVFFNKKICLHKIQISKQAAKQSEYELEIGMQREKVSLLTLGKSVLE